MLISSCQMNAKSTAFKDDSGRQAILRRDSNSKRRLIVP